MTDIFEEVEEAHRKDRFDDAWQKYGWVVWLAGLGIIIAVAANEIMSWQREQALDQRAAGLEAAVAAFEAADYAAAESQFQAIVDGGSSLAPIAAQYLAQVRLEGTGNRDGAVAALEASANLEGDPFQRIAALKAAYLKSDSATLAELEAMLAPLLSGDSPASALAQELVAAKAFEAGDFERARTDFNYLRFAPNAPEGLRRRAEIALTAIPRPAQPEPGATNEQADDSETTSLLTQSAPADTEPAEADDTGGEQP
ncbi:MAG: hypothetical protein AAFR41_06415 [Pseudomonadota bacterium]